MKYTFTTLLLLLTASSIMAQEPHNEDGKKLDKTKMETEDYLPEIHGTIRGKYEYQPEMKASRFQVRNARFSLTGNVHPIVAYKAEIDLSDEGTIKMLDAYTRIYPVNGLSATIGQMRVPFTIDAHRSPHQQYFANRSFIAKQVGNVRDVGATLGYDFKGGFPFCIEAGAFNGSGLTQQKEWHKDLNYSVKAQFFPINASNLTLSMQTIKPDIARIYMYDIGAYYNFCGFHVEGEYLYKNYENNAFKDVHAVNSFINYDLPLRKVFSKISFLARYDMMTDHSNGKANEESGKLEINDYKRHRITGGMTLSIGKKAFVADIRLNYEKYFYRKNAVPLESEQDKLVVEVMTRF
jgi:hypothetical protein